MCNLLSKIHCLYRDLEREREGGRRDPKPLHTKLQPHKRLQPRGRTSIPYRKFPETFGHKILTFTDGTRGELLLTFSHLVWLVKCSFRVNFLSQYVHW